MIQKISILIPVYNEAATIHELLYRVHAQSLPNKLAKEMIIVESNSSDGTREIVRSFKAWATALARQEAHTEVNLILQERSLGKGHAVREGLGIATGEIILIQDGDLEYDTADYPKLLRPLLEKRAKFVLGSRHLTSGSWKVRRFHETPMTALLMNVGGRIFHTLFNTIYGTRLTDPTTMYKVFFRSCLFGVHLESNRFDFDFELVAKLIRLGYYPAEVPVSYQSRSFKQGKKIDALRDPLMWVWAIFKFRYSRIINPSSHSSYVLPVQICKNGD